LGPCGLVVPGKPEECADRHEWNYQEWVHISVMTN
jgi:hypothetical protein